jgi:tetratricopeptide (TPR) repeat protein
MDDIDSDSDDSSCCILDFAAVDLTGVDFEPANENDEGVDEIDSFALELERSLLNGTFEEVLASANEEHTKKSQRLVQLGSLIAEGKYIEALNSGTADFLFGKTSNQFLCSSILNRVRERLSKLESVSQCVEAEFFAIAAFNLFLQLNYTGPSVDDNSLLASINPHACFADCLNSSAPDIDIDAAKGTTLSSKETKYRSTVLSELAVDGTWPCEVSVAPYLLLIARCLLSTLSAPDSTSPGWSLVEEESCTLSSGFIKMADRLVTCSLWAGRATVAHERLLLTREPTTLLWMETNVAFTKCNRLFHGESKHLQATTMLEYGLACHHFGRSKNARAAFKDATEKSGLSLEVTGVQGKRTKFQQKATAQMTVLATSAKGNDSEDPISENVDNSEKEKVKAQMVALSEDSVLLERVKFDDEKANKVSDLLIRDQAILLAFCVDVKYSNPADGLTAEEMRAYLARVLCHHDDWMVYSTALLERAWLDFEGNHTKERSILQMQALADQHTNRLTITQSTRKSVEESSPVQDRLKNIHSIVYPPRWHMLKDVADRYSQLGIVTSAAELYSEIEYWDEVVDCYKRAGKMKLAEGIVRERLLTSETPSMWVALGDIVGDPEYYVKAIELSRGRFLQAFIATGKYYFDKGDLSRAVENYRKALKLRRLQPAVWFRVGTLAMQLKDWTLALSAFSEVVQQNPDEAEGWANVAAIHMHNRQAGEAYAALAEVSFRVLDLLVSTFSMAGDLILCYRWYPVTETQSEQLESLGE